MSLLLNCYVTPGMPVSVSEALFCKVQEVIEPTSASLSQKGNLLEGSLRKGWSPVRPRRLFSIPYLYFSDHSFPCFLIYVVEKESYQLLSFVCYRFNYSEMLN